MKVQELKPGMTIKFGELTEEVTCVLPLNYDLIDPSISKMIQVSTRFAKGRFPFGQSFGEADRLYKFDDEVVTA
jgi:hypothetical protein